MGDYIKEKTGTELYHYFYDWVNTSVEDREDQGLRGWKVGYGGSKRVGRKSRRNAKSKKLNKRKKSKQTKKRKTMKKKKRRV